MERLTFMDNGEPAYRFKNCVYKNEIAQKLSAYEDTGLTPEEVETLKADNDRLHIETEAKKQERTAEQMKLSQLKVGRRYWFSSGYYIYSGLYSGKIKMCGKNNNVPLAILQDRNGNEWVISPDMLCLRKDDAVKRYKQPVRG